jgi:hypothetical protein
MLRTAVALSKRQSTGWRTDAIFTSLASSFRNEPALVIPPVGTSEAGLEAWRTLALAASVREKNFARALSKQNRRDTKRREANKLHALIRGKCPKARKNLAALLSHEPQHTLRIVRTDDGSLLTNPAEVNAEVARQYSRDFLQPRPTVASAQAPWRAGPTRVTLRGATHEFARGAQLLTDTLYRECKDHLTGGTAPGEDRIPNELIKSMPDEVHDFLLDLFRLCWKTGTTPACWKESTTIMLHKKGDPHKVTNYRPIGLCNTLAKLHTAVVARILLRICESGGLLSDS